MPHEVRGPAGRLLIDDQGQLRFERNGRLVLQSAQTPAFALAYGVEWSATLPAQVTHAAHGLRIEYDTSQPGLRLALEVETLDAGFRLIWTAPAWLPVLGVRWLLEPQGPWYGMGERVIQPWPLDRLPVEAQPFMPYDHAADGTLNIGTPLWYNAGGAAILVEEGACDLAVTLNRGQDGLLRILARMPEASFSGFDQLRDVGELRMALSIVLADDLPQAFRRLLPMLGLPGAAPPEELLARPIWTTWARYKMAVTQADVLTFAEEIAARDYPRSVMEIDDRWQEHYGTCAFDAAKFPDPRGMVERLHQLGFKVTLWVPPFFDPAGAGFREAARQGFLVRHPATGEPYLTRWWQGYGGLLDVSNRAALDWWRERLEHLQAAYGIDGFKFDGGEANFLPSDALLAQPMLRRQYTDRYVQWVAQHWRWTEVRAGWRSQAHGILFRQWDKWSRWGIDNGLHSVLTQALTLSLIGYPFILPDMIGGNAYGSEYPDRELLIRWTQLTALLPAMQFSIAPWQFDAETDAICRRYALLHTEIAPYIQSLAEQTLRDGSPLVRPLFWHAPGDATALRLDDQFLLGDLLLVAPVLKPGQRQRDIYLPQGCWRERASGVIYDGPCWLTDYPAPLDYLPLFERLEHASRGDRRAEAAGGKRGTESDERPSAS